MWLIHHVSEILILNQGCSQKYNYNENIHVDNNKIRTLEIMREKREITVPNPSYYFYPTVQSISMSTTSANKT